MVLTYPQRCDIESLMRWAEALAPDPREANDRAQRRQPVSTPQPKNNLPVPVPAVETPTKTVPTEFVLDPQPSLTRDDPPVQPVVEAIASETEVSGISAGFNRQQCVLALAIFEEQRARLNKQAAKVNREIATIEQLIADLRAKLGVIDNCSSPQPPKLLKARGPVHRF